jgi:hypothetical protein
MKIFLTILLLVGLSGAQTERPGIQPQMNTIYVGSDGKFEAAPDTAVLQLNIAAQGDTSRAAYDKAAAAAERVRQVLKANGIDPKTAQVGFYAVQPIYDWKNPKRRVVGYRVATNVTLKLRDFEKVGPITQQAADIQDTQNQSLNYVLENMEAAKEKATEDAFKKARNQANAVATTAGRNLGELLYASVDVNQQVIVPMRGVSNAMRASAPEAAPPTEEFTPQTVTITAHVTAMFGMK